MPCRRVEELLIRPRPGAPLAADFVNRAREEVMFGTVTRAAQLRPPSSLPGRHAGAASQTLTGSPAASFCSRRERSGQDDDRRKLASSSRGRQVVCCWPRPTRSAPRRSSSWSSGGAHRRRGHRRRRLRPCRRLRRVKAATARALDVADRRHRRRLHTQTNLMDGSRSSGAVVERQLPGAPHETLMSSTPRPVRTGLRRPACSRGDRLTGVCLDQARRTAKAGSSFRIVRELKVPVKLIGLGSASRTSSRSIRQAFVDASWRADGRGVAGRFMRRAIRARRAASCGSRRRIRWWAPSSSPGGEVVGRISRQAGAAHAESKPTGGRGRARGGRST